MHPNDALVPVVGPLAHGVADAIGQPPLQVFPEGRVARVVGDPAYRVAAGFGELAFHALR
jgi:hypothetical protein